MSINFVLEEIEVTPDGPKKEADRIIAELNAKGHISWIMVEPDALSGALHHLSLLTKIMSSHVITYDEKINLAIQGLEYLFELLTKKVFRVTDPLLEKINDVDDDINEIITLYRKTERSARREQ